MSWDTHFMWLVAGVFLGLWWGERKRLIGLLEAVNQALAESKKQDDE